MPQRKREMKGNEERNYDRKERFGWKSELGLGHGENESERKKEKERELETKTIITKEIKHKLWSDKKGEGKNKIGKKIKKIDKIINMGIARKTRINNK